MRDKLLRGLARAHANHPWRMLALVGLLTLLFAVAATQLSVTMRWSDLLPSHDPRTEQFNKIIKEFKTSTSLIVVLQGEEARIKAFADELAPRITKTVNEKTNEPLYQRVDYKAETNYLKNHGLMLVKKDDLEDTGEMYLDPNLTGLLQNINNAMEKEYVGREESISTREKEDNAVMFLDGLENFVQLLQRYGDGESVSEKEAQDYVDKLLLGDPYFLSYDQKALILNAIPNFTMMDTDKLIVGTEAVQQILDDMQSQYPDVQAGLTGFVAIGHDEMVYSEKSLGYTSLIAVIAIFLLLVLSFRMWMAPLLALFTLLIGTIWAIGTAALVVGQLNIMTQMMTVILFGLGIDFSIHIISTFTERRAAGETILDSMVQTFEKSGKGVLTGALTTSFAFLALLISHSRGMKEMGLVTGFGLMAILLATLLMLPSLLVFRERRLEKKRAKGKTHVQRDLSFTFLGSMAQRLSRIYPFTLIFTILVTGLMFWLSSKMTFDYNYLNIEPKGLTSIALQDTVLDKFDMSMDYALITAATPEESRQLTEQYKEFGSVAMAEDISLYLPSPQQQQERLPLIQDIQNRMRRASIRSKVAPQDQQKLRDELERLQMNVMEMQDMAFLGGQDKVDNKCKALVGDPESDFPKDKIDALLDTLRENQRANRVLAQFQRDVAPRYQQAVLQMSSTKAIQLADLPESILDRYTNDSRDLFLITVFPAGGIWQDALFLNQFVDDLESVTPRATGMPPVFRALIQVIGQDGRRAMLVTLVIVFLLLWLDFGKPKYALLALAPLAFGVIWMVGLMYLTRQQFTVMNVMGLPMILGIGIDDGVHVMHRYISEGKQHIFTVFSSTGKAILLTTLTTMLAFGSLAFSIWRGFAQLGAALFVGVAACFLATIIFIPGILGLIHRKDKV